MPILDSPLLAANFPKKFISLTLLCVQRPIIVSQNRNFRENFSSRKLVGILSEAFFFSVFFSYF